MSQGIVDTNSPAKVDAKTLEAEYGLSNYGFRNLRNVYWNLSPEAIIKEIVFRSEGMISDTGSVIVTTGQRTNLAANDRFIAREGASEDEVSWGEYNRPFDLRKYSAIYRRMLAYVQGRDLFVRDCYAGADPNYRLSVRVISEYAWHSLVAHNLLIQPETNDELRQFIPGFTVIAVPSFRTMPEVDGTESGTFILLNIDQRICLIGGSAYSGEIKKAVFTALNYLLPHEHVLSMRCSANVDQDGNSALFFGLSGSGKTTLAIHPDRPLIGDDEHGWSDEGIFNLEGGCYARMFGLPPTDQTEIHACTLKSGTVLENVAYDSASRRLDFDDASLTVNSRTSFPLSHIENSVAEKMAGHPKNIVMLTCDATGIMPPIARLTPEQAMYHFISGYSCQIAGTDNDPESHPEQTFSPCFDAQSMIFPPSRYATMLRDKILRHGTKCWLVNTGWTGGPCGIGRRISIEHNRMLIDMVLSGALDQIEYWVDPVFGFEVPKHCEGVPDTILVPKDSWGNPQLYDEKHVQLALQFVENFKKYQDGCPVEIVKAGPDPSKR